MSKQPNKVEVEVDELKDAAASSTGVKLETEARVDGRLHDTSIEVSQADVPALATALLNADGPASSADPLPAAVKCLGAGVVEAIDVKHVRIHLQFESGQVLPIEMTHAAALALCRGILRRVGVTPDGGSNGSSNGGRGTTH
ncbi:MAG TPA: hypothetical protein VMU47_15415 [Caldimonas sp.]|nr:hypothetical protein [Caldimonas sp.]